MKCCIAICSKSHYPAESRTGKQYSITQQFVLCHSKSLVDFHVWHTLPALKSLTVIIVFVKLLRIRSSSPKIVAVNSLK